MSDNNESNLPEISLPGVSSDDQVNDLDLITLEQREGSLHDSPPSFPRKINVKLVEFDGKMFEVTTLRSFIKLLKTGHLAFVLGKTGGPVLEAESTRAVFPGHCITNYEVSDTMITVKFVKHLVDIIYPPRPCEDECKELFIAFEKCNNPEIKLYFEKVPSKTSVSVARCLRQMAERTTFIVEDSSLGLLSSNIVHYSDYLLVQWRSVLKETEKKAEKAQLVFGGPLEAIELDLEDKNEETIIIFHPEDQQEKILYAKIDEEQSFVLHFPGGTELEAKWPKDYTLGYIMSRVFKLCLPGMTEHHRMIIKRHQGVDLSTPESEFRLEAKPNEVEKTRCRKILKNAVDCYRSKRGFPIGPIFFTHPDRSLGTEIDQNVAEVLATSALNAQQRVSATHALCKTEELFSGIALLTGAPGTGKTFTAATIVKAASVSTDYNKIIVTTKKNTTLQRIFEAVMDVLDNRGCKVLYIQGKIASEKMEKSASQKIRELVKKHEIQRHLEVLQNPSDSSASKRKTIIGEHHVIFATLDIIQRDIDSSIFPASFVLIDEAAATSELDSLIPITKFNKSLKRLVLVGDPMQLKPYSAAEDSCVTKRSLFLRCQQSDWALPRLIDNYRMHPQVADPIRSMFYNTDSMVRWGLMKERKTKEFLLESPESAKGIAGSLTTLEVMKNFNPKIKSLSSWWDVPGREETVGSSFGNEAEVEALLIILDYIRSSDELKAEDIDLGKVGVTTFYTGQIHAIKDAVNERFPDWITEGLEIASINAFQGREKDIMLISLVRANECDEVGLLNKQNRICTALSRAKICQIIVRNFDFIRNQIRRKFDGVKRRERKAIVEAGRVHELQGGKHAERPLSTLLRDHKWNRFQDDRINPFLEAQEEEEMERFEGEA
ncbi:hypothetical protein TWF679_005494 [Orbilia oligospora]|uniref:Uncharacterized protein n=1 Tax=Orbilia oligospora TaxID=2813651 RepID=A0A8H8VBM9_ORBOL|nr:hypothetical protein TWF679_005494 [Orbilia oligospora]